MKVKSCPKNKYSGTKYLYFAPLDRSHSVSVRLLFWQDDGNFVVYGWKPVWASDTAGTDVYRLCMQSDCNLVMYTKCDKPKWHTNSANKCLKMCRLYLTDEGKLVVYREAEQVWSSADASPSSCP